MSNSDVNDEVAQQFEHARQLREAGKLVEARDYLETIVAGGSESIAVFAVLASVHWEMQNLRDAISLFRRATELAPRNELASLGLFHTLWESGMHDAAFAEIKRLVSLRPSHEYQLMLKGINDG